MRGGLALALVAALTMGVAGCTGEGGDGDGVSLPTALPSVDRPERTATRTAEPTRTEATRTEATRTEATEDPEETTGPTRTRETAAPVTTTEPVKTTEPVRTTQPAQTRTPERTVTEAPAATTTPAAEATQSAQAAVPVSESDDTGSFWPWLLLFLAIGGVIGLVLIGRSRRETAWDGEGRALAVETRSLLGVRLPPVLTARTAAERGLSWPPVRDDLRDLSARWGLLSQNAPDGDRHASSSQIAVLLRDLAPAIDAENEALAAGRDWRMLRPQVDAILDGLAALLQPQPRPQLPPQQPPQPGPNRRPPPTEPYYA
ncbi:hypothetical protein AMIS_18160 [Actinoplanes missouriensis 431]|uniref:DUF4129 domain-containing protein n=1 Tax=Actinoplanes missouriensis (strain ATCC 14538 / DSM 43046 / CBS 188.64 / JCM 3121 / NBRC 102363 / NCIMB 12654 / NRRL B-3342 / UNCC 431) TaxID=512565 RepID=I0H1Z9_ACTM4|nr:hypothetical protein [Actinoplanes missouriensis]BAL87036.1 hypothetical protein AMIS_18160 [Actinoplanes missouriensis 431]